MKIKLFSFICAIFAVGQLGAQNISLTPNNGNRGQTLPIVISGQSTNFNAQASGTLIFMQGSYSFSQATITVIDPFNLFAVVTVPNNAPFGFYDLFVDKGSNHLEANAFMVSQGTNIPQMAVSPAGGKPGNTITNTVITIPGASFKTQGTGIHSAWLSRNGEAITTLSNINVINSNTFSVDVDLAASATQGKWDVNVYTNEDLMYTKSEAFLIDFTFSTGEWGISLNDFELYPNPAQSELNLTYDQNVEADIEIKIVDMIGRVVLQPNTIDYENKTVKMNVSSLTKGTYMIQFMYRGRTISTQKWIKE